MDEQESLVEQNFPLFSKQKKKTSSKNPVISKEIINEHHEIEKLQENGAKPCMAFADLGLSEWAVKTCSELGMKNPTPVQQHCIPRILAGQDVLGLAQTGSGKTAAFALPILHKLAEDPYGVSALVLTPTRELAYQLADQFRALGSTLHVRCAVVVGGMDMIAQLKTLMRRPHIVISTPGRIKVLLEENPDMPPVFERTKFLVLDEADRVLDVSFAEDLGVIFQYLPDERQTLLFSATMTSNLQMLLEVSANKAFFYEAYEGLKIVDSLKQQYLLVPHDVKEIFLVHILSKIETMGVRSVIIFVSKAKTCRLLSLLLEELDQNVAELHSYISQSSRLAALHRFKSGQVPSLIATDVASRGLDIPSVDLVINYDLPRDPRDYVHRVGRTARAGREGLAVSFVTAFEEKLVLSIEEKIGSKLEEFKCKVEEVHADSKAYKARRVAKMKLHDDTRFEELDKERRKQKQKTLKHRKRKRNQQEEQ